MQVTVLMLLYFEGYHQGEPEHQGRINSPWMEEMDQKLLELLKLPGGRLQVKRLARASRNSSGDDGTLLQKPLLERALLLVSKTGKRTKHKHFLGSAVEECLAGDRGATGRGFEPYRCHCVVVLEQDTFILAEYWFNPGRPVPV